MKKIRISLLAICISLMAACSTQRNAAPVIERTPTKSIEQTRLPVRTENRGFHTVRKGDTLNRIAAEYAQNTRDLMAWNNISNPNDIKVDQVLRVLPPDGTVAPQAGAVASSSGVEVRPLPAAAADKPSPVITHKTGPRGDKRPYSEAILADMQKPDGLATPVSNIPKQAVKPGDLKATEKPAAAPDVPGDDEGIAWMWPAEGKIIATFDEGKSKGIDIAGKIGQQVVAAGSGKVMYAGSGIRGYGNLVIVKHNNNLLSAYAHNHTILVKEGQSVNKGQKIAEMGKSDAEAVKLHFEIRRQGKPVDPSKFLPSR